MDESARSSRLRLLMLGGAALVAAILVASQTYLSMLHHGHEWWRLFLWQSLSWLFWAGLAPTLVARGETARDQPRIRWAISTTLIGAILVATHIGLSAAVLVWLQPYLPVELMNFTRAVGYLQTPWALVDALVVVLLIGTGHVIAGRRQTRAMALRESRLEAELAKAQLEALRLKMQPHFLFNTLNSIAALVRKRANEEALDMVIGLSHLLRLSLDRSDDQLVTLHQEVDFVDRYVELHVKRFADRLDFRRHVATDSLDYTVPSLILQPLVENAIRHGVARSPNGAVVILTIEPVRDGVVTMRVEDDGPGLPSGFSLRDAEGVGLGSIRSRLELLYDERARLSLTERRGGGTVAEIDIPVEASRQLMVVNQ